MRGDGVGADALVRLRVRARRRRLPASISIGGRPARWRPCSDIISVPPAMTRSSMPAMTGAGRDVDRGDARAAEAVERHAAGAHVVAGVERRHAAEVAALRAATWALVPQMMSSTSAVSKPLRSASASQHRGAEVLRVEVGERALARLADAARRAAGVDDQCVRHGALLECFLQFLLLAIFQRIFRKKSRTSLTNRSGCSNAAKWPPFGISLQWRDVGKARLHPLAHRRDDLLGEHGNAGRHCDVVRRPPLRPETLPIEPRRRSCASRSPNRASHCRAARRG